MGANQRKGADHERKTTEFFQWDNAFGGVDGAVWLHQAGINDKGDVEIRRATDKRPVVTIQCKSTKEFDLAGAVKDAVVQSENAGSRYGVACLKAPGKNISKAYVVMYAETFRDMLRDGL